MPRGLTNLKVYRIRAGLTQESLAEAIGVQQETISYYERGLSIPPHHAKAIVDELSSRLKGGFPLEPHQLTEIYQQE